MAVKPRPGVCAVTLSLVLGGGGENVGGESAGGVGQVEGGGQQDQAPALAAGAVEQAGEVGDGSGDPIQPD